MKKLGLFWGTWITVIAIVGCGSVLKTYDELNDPTDDVALKHCREEGRSAREAGAPAADAYGVYVECTKEAGLR